MKALAFLGRLTCLTELMVLFLLAGWTVPSPAQSVNWIQQISTSDFEFTRHAAADGGSVYVVGTTGGTLPQQVQVGAGDAFVRSYNAANGNEQWTRQFGTAGADDPFAVDVNATGVYVTGYVAGSLDPLQPYLGSGDVFVRKYNVSGTPLWTRMFGTVNNDIGRAVVVDETGVYVAGYTGGDPLALGASTGADIFVRKYTLDGEFRWNRSFGLAGTIRHMVVDSTGIYVTGWTGADAFVRKFDTDGDQLWRQEIANASGSWLALYPTGVYLAGSTGGTLPGQNNRGGLDSFLRKYNRNGNELWTRQFGSAGNDNATGVEIALGSVYVAGITTGSLPGNTNAGNSDGFVTRFDGAGNNLGSLQIGTPSRDDVFGSAADATGIYLLGLTEGRLPGETTLGSADGFVIRLAASLPKPKVSSGGVVNNASFKPSPAKVAPGSITAIFGASLNDGSEVLSSSFLDGKLVTTLGGSSVKFNGIPAPMFYSTPGQLGVQVPFELAGQASANIEVTVGNEVSPPETVLLDSAEPGIFTQNQSGTGNAAVLHQDGVTPVAAANPAHPGEWVVLYATGLGVLNPPLPTGAPSVGNTTAAPATVTIDGLPGTVEFSGSAPGFVGLNQINVRIPPAARSGADIPVILTIDGRQSNTVTIPVGP